MAQGLQQIQKQSQALILSPQLRQSLKILQVPALELRSAILQELEANPTLEELPLEGSSFEELAAAPDAEAGGASDYDEELNFDANLDTLRRIDQDWRDGLAAENTGTYDPDRAERREHFFDSLTAGHSLQEHLLDQLRLTDLSTDERQAAELIIGSLDESGFLATPVADLSLLTGLPFETVENALKVVRTFDPPGIAAADLRHSLMLQLELKDRGKSLAWRILDREFPLLLRRRVQEIARNLAVDTSAIEHALAEIGTLDPAPGRQFSDDTNQAIIPDVTFEKVEDQWVIRLNNDYIPRLRLNSTYKDLLAKESLSAKEKEYLREQMRNGRFLISAIEQRQQTIEKIAREILRRQLGFFEEGVAKLQPMTMAQVAEAVGVHETTVSRTVANKYADTPWGIFDLKYFFRAGYTAADGTEVANTTVKEAIARIIAAESPAKPLSDNAIATILAKQQITIARRTVAKYREELGIPPTNLRRRF